MRKSLADRIEQYIKVLIERSEEKQIEIQRAELAETFCCVPSQVTYVISTRFTREGGYITESRRGGKGYVRIARFQLISEQQLQRRLNELIELADDLHENRYIDSRQKQILYPFIIRTLQNVPEEQRLNLIEAMERALLDYVKQSTRPGGGINDDL